jgi:hypothetical protein
VIRQLRWLIILSVRGDVAIDNESFLVTDFMNFNIKSNLPFKNARRNKVCMYIYCVCFFKKSCRPTLNVVLVNG